MDNITMLLEILAEIKENGFSWDARYDDVISKAILAAPTPSAPASKADTSDWEAGYAEGCAVGKAFAVEKASTPAPVAKYIATLPADWHVDSSFETWFPLKAEELESTKRMFLEACSDLGLISEKLGIDPDEAGGAGPILDAIEELKCAAPPTRPDVGDALKEAVCTAIAEALGDALDCTRTWSAWSVGTMSDDDFVTVSGDPERVSEIADAAIAAMLAPQSSEKEVGETKETK